MSQQFTTAQVAQHNNYGDLWVIINDNVYDLSKFADVHPAGRNVLKDYAGKNVTQLFNQFHSQSILHKYHDKLFIGTVSDKQCEMIVPLKEMYPDLIGEGIPHGDCNSIQGWKSPYYNESHRVLRKGIREYLQKEVAPFVDGWDDKKVVPKEVFKKIADSGVLPLIVGQPWPEKYYPKKIIGGVEFTELDYFHEMIVLEESVKYSSIGIIWGLGACAIGLPPIIQHGSDYLKDKYVGNVLRGEQVICLCVTEPWAGSDVANVQCKAELSEDGKHYIVNGMKKFITSGALADLFTVAVRTGGEGYFGVSLIVIEKTMPGVKVRPMNMQGVWGSGTAFIIFENVKVPVENIIGDEGIGFMYIMQNFNHERFQVIVECYAASRCILEECIKYSHQRTAFGKRLIDQPVIRQKIAHMIKEVETLQAYTELIAYNFKIMPKKQEKVMASAIAIAKSQGTVIFEKVASEGMQIMGGLGYQRGSAASKVERYYRECKSLTLGGGSPEVMFDLSIRMSSSLMPKPKI